MTVDVRIRRAGAADAHAVADVWLRSRHASVPAIPPSAHADEDVRTWITTILVPGGGVWVAVADDGSVVGMMALRDGWVNQLYVDPDWTGRGIGTRLLEVATREHPVLDLWAFQSNAGAVRFYARHGFIEVERTDGSTNEERSPDVHMRWERGAS